MSEYENPAACPVNNNNNSESVTDHSGGGTVPDHNGDWEPVIVAFLCTWCSYSGADLAGTSRLQYPASIRIIRVPCSGRINPLYIIKALAEGADGVMVSGCHPGDCHYLAGNLFARRRFVVLKKLLESCGLDPDRVQFTWVSASEGGRFAEVIREVTENVRKIGPNRILRDGGALSAPDPIPQTGGDLTNEGAAAV